MVYQGSKNKLAKHILPFIKSSFDELKSKYQKVIYLEPFVGGGNMIKHVAKKIPEFNKYIGTDYNKYLIELLKYRRKMYLPYFDWEIKDKALINTEYKYMRDIVRGKEANVLHVPDAVLGAYMLLFSYRAMWCGGIAISDKGAGSIRLDQYINNLNHDDFSKISFYEGDFNNILKDTYHSVFLNKKEPTGIVIYMDPPYVGAPQDVYSRTKNNVFRFTDETYFYLEKLNQEDNVHIYLSGVVKPDKLNWIECFKKLYKYNGNHNQNPEGTKVEREEVLWRLSKKAENLTN